MYVFVVDDDVVYRPRALSEDTDEDASSLHWTLTRSRGNTYKMIATNNSLPYLRS